MSAVDLNPYKPRGVDFIRFCAAAMQGKDSVFNAWQAAEARWGPESKPALLLKAAVSAGGLTPGSNWGPALAEYRVVAQNFYALIEQRAIVGKLGLRKIPLRTRVVSVATGSVAYWSGETKGKPI